MGCRKNAVSAGVLLVTNVLLFGVCAASLHAWAAQPATGGEREDIAELKERVAKLEAEVAEMRKALRQAGGTPDSATEMKNVREVAKLRSAELLQRTQNTHAILRQILANKVAGKELLDQINDLNNEMADLWMTIAGYGLGRDPYLDNIHVSSSGFGRAKPPPDHGLPRPYVGMGLPRLHERYLEASGAKEKAAEKRNSDLKKLVRAYSNPAVFPHRAFYERAYSEYREGRGLDTPQYAADLKALDQWLTDLQSTLDKVPGHFEKAP
jgi:hypothetical protein